MPYTGYAIEQKKNESILKRKVMSLYPSIKSLKVGEKNNVHQSSPWKIYKQASKDVAPSVTEEEMERYERLRSVHDTKQKQ